MVRAHEGRNDMTNLSDRESNEGLGSIDAKNRNAILKRNELMEG
jgi:hypothetical protein